MKSTDQAFQAQTGNDSADVHRSFIRLIIVKKTSQRCHRALRPLRHGWRCENSFNLVAQVKQRVRHMLALRGKGSHKVTIRVRITFQAILAMRRKECRNSPRFDAYLDRIGPMLAAIRSPLGVAASPDKIANQQQSRIPEHRRCRRAKWD